MSNIVTFYSYKGGVGRSMAMANIAVLLAQRGLRVLAVDWDLEAPGLERYFSYFNAKPSGEGLLNLLIEHQRGANPDPRDYIWQIAGNEFALDLVPSGKESDSEYAAKLERFDWDEFFSTGGGDYIESLREKCRESYDLTLIDSRTGLSDAGGICTIQLPDIAVAMFSANHQSLYGVRDIMRLAQMARHDLAYDRMHLAVVPLPARFGSRTEFRESQEWLGRFAEVLGEFYEDWLPTWLEPRKVVEILKVPQVDYFGFGEKLAVVEQGSSDPDSMGFVYGRIASLLSNDLQDVEKVLRIDPPSELPVGEGRTRQAGRVEYEYDLYVSYARDAVLTEWLRTLGGQLQSWLEIELGRDLRVFFDYGELDIGDRWSELTRSHLLRSKILLAALTPKYVRSEHCLREWATFEHRERITASDSQLIVPIRFGRKDWMPELAHDRQVIDMSGIPLHASAFNDKKLLKSISRRVRKIAEAIAEALEHAPPIDSRWKLADKPSDTTLPSP